MGGWTLISTTSLSLSGSGSNGNDGMTPQSPEFQNSSLIIPYNLVTSLVIRGTWYIILFSVSAKELLYMIILFFLLFYQSHTK